jgi:chemotaxis protein methyltransferase CheR
MNQEPGMTRELCAMEMTSGQFDVIRSFLYSACGIRLTEGKESLVKSRLMKRIRVLGLGSFDDYMSHLRNDTANQEGVALIDALTTNKTSFFREYDHFTFLREQILPHLMAEKREIKIWSAGCSTGEEPYSIAMELMESIPDISRCPVRILATDISIGVLKQACAGIYGPDGIRDVPAGMVRKYFTCSGTGSERTFQVRDEVKKLVRVAPLNLMGNWPMKGPFDVIFCRNVMIYFDKSTQQWLVQRFWQLIRPGGYLLAGHSESLTGSAHRFRYVQPAIYLR